jgi:hypothetical protein
MLTEPHFRSRVQYTHRASQKLIDEPAELMAVDYR